MSVILPSFAQCMELTGGFSGTPDEQLKMLQAHRQSYQSIFHWRLIQIFSIKIASLKVYNGENVCCGDPNEQLF